MSETMVSGQVDITPPLKFSQFEDSIFYPETHNRRRRGSSLILFVEKEVSKTDTGTATTITATRVVPAHEGRDAHGAIVANLQELMNTYPDHLFEGEFMVYPDTGYEQFPHRVIARGHEATRQDAVVTWKDSSESA